MKKYLKKLLLICLCLTLTVGCGNENIDLDLEKINEELIGLTSDKIEVSLISSNVEQYFENAEFIYDFDFESRFALNRENIEEYSVMANFETMDMYLVLNPIDGKEETVKKELNNHFTMVADGETNEEIKSKIENRKFAEYEGLLIYVIADNTDEVYNAIINSKSSIYGMLMPVDDEALEQVLGINPSDVSEYSISIPGSMISTSLYMIVKPNEGKEDVVKEAINTYMTNLESQMEFYLVDQYELVKNRLEKEYGGYLIYIVSTDNDKVYNAIVG